MSILLVVIIIRVFIIFVLLSLKKLHFFDKILVDFGEIRFRFYVY